MVQCDMRKKEVLMDLAGRFEEVRSPSVNWANVVHKSNKQELEMIMANELATPSVKEQKKPLTVSLLKMMQGLKNL
ncbi:hypothetical protein ACH5RR_040815 [Cinchona calisaya]|uniref:Uncharacterized protein n=1 Tax=Cinchona calisaya TaxID=153742 RepID=A0ABD2XTE0_9GENT